MPHIKKQAKSKDASPGHSSEEFSIRTRCANMSDEFQKQFLDSEADQIRCFNEEQRNFRERCYLRWNSALDLLQIFRRFCIELGSIFQNEFCLHDAYQSDPLLGILMRLHANACRIAGEVEALLRSGYPDGALARWRTLHETAVTAILIRRYGKSAAEDFIRFGFLEAVKGMEAYQETARDMGRVPYSQRELDEARRVRDEILAAKPEFEKRPSWAVPYTGVAKFHKLQNAAGLARWASDYKWASHNVHAVYRDTRALLGMAEAYGDGLLVGPSDSGFTDPAHFSAIALSQVTYAFVTCYMDDEESAIDFKRVAIALPTLDYLLDEIGKRFKVTDLRHTTENCDDP